MTDGGPLATLVNGEVADVVSVHDRGFAYGDGLFETVAVDGGVPRWWQGHVDRLRAGCERLGLPSPDQAVLLREVQTVSAGSPRCSVKIILTRGRAGRGYAPPQDVSPTRVVSAFTWRGDDLDAGGIRLRVCRTRLAIQPALGGIKHLNRLEQVLARGEWSDPRIDEGLMLDAEDHVICATAANLFVVINGRILTPRLDRCGVRGVLRGEVLKAFRARVEQRRLSVDILPDAEEVFLTSTLRGVRPVVAIDQYEYQPGPVTQSVRDWYREAVEA